MARLGSDWPPIFRHAVTLAQGTDDEGKAHWLRAWPAVVEEATGLLETASPGHAEPPSEQMHRVLCAVFAAFDASLGSRVPDALAQPGHQGSRAFAAVFAIPGWRTPPPSWLGTR